MLRIGIALAGQMETRWSVDWEVPGCSMQGVPCGVARTEASADQVFPGCSAQGPLRQGSWS